MNKQEIKDFILLANNGKPIRFFFVNSTKGPYKNLLSFAAVVERCKRPKPHKPHKLCRKCKSIKRYIVLDTTAWNITNNSDEYYQYFSLLHEIGHIRDPNYINASTSELYAQQFAIQRARELNMPHIVVEAVSALERWGRFSYFGKQRVYCLAYELAKKQGFFTQHGFA